ncbi:MAG TPA: DUF2306 domain-containing protein [Acidobacteriaceae bacterium]|nr:DUF2306 domain-containing protein [Acidobacteriaceae bacterium]
MSSLAQVARPLRSLTRLPKVILLAALLLVGAGFVWHYVFHYYLHYNPADYGPYWTRRLGLLMHITSGMVALLVGPWQFSRRLRQRRAAVHRLMGRVYLIAIACGSTAGTYLAVTTTFGWAWGLALVSLALAWATTGGMAYFAIRRREIQIHQEWMVRSYIVTFAFVSFRFLNDMSPLARFGPSGERAVTLVWACWVLPLLAAEVILQLRHMRPRSRKPAERVAA